MERRVGDAQTHRAPSRPDPSFKVVDQAAAKAICGCRKTSRMEESGEAMVGARLGQTSTLFRDNQDDD